MPRERQHAHGRGDDIRACGGVHRAGDSPGQLHDLGRGVGTGRVDGDGGTQLGGQRAPLGDRVDRDDGARPRRSARPSPPDEARPRRRRTPRCLAAGADHVEHRAERRSGRCSPAGRPAPDRSRPAAVPRCGSGDGVGGEAGLPEEASGDRRSVQAQRADLVAAAAAHVQVGGLVAVGGPVRARSCRRRRSWRRSARTDSPTRRAACGPTADARCPRPRARTPWVPWRTDGRHADVGVADPDGVDAHQIPRQPTGSRSSMSVSCRSCPASRSTAARALIT